MLSPHYKYGSVVSCPPRFISLPQMRSRTFDSARLARGHTHLGGELELPTKS